jgi:hypothetical protein
VRRGKKPNTPAELKARGTFRPVRHKGLVELDTATDVPVQPDWLTDAGRAAWADLLEHVIAARSATVADSAVLGTLCNLIGASAQAWQAGAVPPAAHLAEQRRLAELFRVGGAASRVGLPEGVAKDNPFLRLLREPRDER